MKVEQVKITKFKKLEDFEHNIDGANILLIGENGVGKSSFMQFIEIALGSKEIPPNIAGQGHVIVNKDGHKYTINVKVKDGNSRLEVTTQDGFKSTNKGFIADMCGGAIDFDVEEFVELAKNEAGRKKQVAIFKSMLPETVATQVARLETETKQLYDERTRVNAERDSINGAIEHMRGGIPCPEPASTEELSNQLMQATAHNALLKSKVDRMNVAMQEEADLRRQITSLQNKFNAVTQEIDAIENFIVSSKEIDTAELEQSIKEQDTKRQNYINYQNYLKKETEYTQLKAKAENLTDKITKCRNAITSTIIDANPLPDVTLTDEGLFYKGVMVEENTLSTSEIMELGFKLKMAKNPDLGILFIPRGESLGREKCAALLEFSQKNNVQIIMEQVQRGEEQLKIEIFS